MTIVVKLGGTNGSGKTSVARALLALDTQPLPVKCSTKGTKTEGYLANVKGKMWAILGSYENACGGMDTISDKNDRLALVRRYIEDDFSKVVFFEGLITGKTYGAFGAMSEEPAQVGKWLYAFMDTPYDACVARVMQRREAAGNTKPFDPRRTMLPTYKSVQSTARRAAELGHATIWLPHTLPPNKLAHVLIKQVSILEKAG